MANFSYDDKKIIHDSRLYYLRTKIGRRGATCVMTIRTHRNGKGRNIAQVKGVISNKESQIELMQKLHRKFKFKIVQLVDVPPIKR